MAHTIYDDIKKRIDLVEIIKQDFPLKGHGNQYRGDRDDCNSLVVTCSHASGEWYYFWNSKSEGGDVFTWLKNQRGMDQKSALEYAAQKAGITLPEWSSAEYQTWLQMRAVEDVLAIAARIFQKWLKETPAAIDYARSRGFADATIENAMLGFSGLGTPAEYQEMRDTMTLKNIDPESPAAVAILGFKGDISRLKEKWESELGLMQAIKQDDIDKGYISGFMSRPRLIYPHLYFQRVTYISSRNLLHTDDGKLVNDPNRKHKSYNPRRELIGERQPYFGWNYRADADHIVIVEGQADALTLAQWGFNVFAQVGTALDQHWGKEFNKRHETCYYATDNDGAGRTAVWGKDNDFPIAQIISPLTHVVTWPTASREKVQAIQPIKDANDLLQSYQQRGVPDSLQTRMIKVRLNRQPILATLAAQYARTTSNIPTVSSGEKNRVTMRAYEIIAMIKSENKLTAELTNLFLAILNVSKSGFNANLKLALGEKAAKEDATKNPGNEPKFILGGWFPIEQDSNKGWLVDYLYNPHTGKASFAYRDPDGRIGKADSLTIKGIRYYPRINDANINGGVVMFASDLGPAKSTRELIAWNELYMKRSFLLDHPLDYKLAAYYAQFTWLYDCFDELAYLRAQGESDSGKSAIMLRIGYVCYRLFKTSGVGSTASLKYMQHIYRGSVFMDEMKDDLEDFDDRVVMLNIGAMKEQAWATNAVPVKLPDGSSEPDVQSYFVYGPKLVTMYGRFPQDATESRFLTIKTIKHELQELIDRNIPRRWSDEMRAQALYKRNLDLTWRLMNWQPRLQPPDELEDPRVSTRVNQVTVPIKYILTLDGDHNSQTELALDEVNQVVKNLYEEQKFEKSQSTDARIIEAIDAVINDPAFKILNFVHKSEFGNWGSVKYITHAELAKVVNYIIDEINLGAGKSPEATLKAQDEEDGGKKKKNHSSSVTAGIVGKKCHNLRIPVHKLGRGFVVLLESSMHPDEVQKRIELLKMRYGLITSKMDTQASPEEKFRQENLL